MFFYTKSIRIILSDSSGKNNSFTLMMILVYVFIKYRVLVEDVELDSIMSLLKCNSSLLNVLLHKKVIRII